MSSRIILERDGRFQSIIVTWRWKQIITPPYPHKGTWYCYAENIKPFQEVLIKHSFSATSSSKKKYSLKSGLYLAPWTSTDVFFAKVRLKMSILIRAACVFVGAAFGATLSSWIFWGVDIFNPIDPLAFIARSYIAFSTIFCGWVGWKLYEKRK